LSLEDFQQRIRDAAARRAPLRLRGGGSKDFYGAQPRGDVLDTRAYAGIVDYEPTELVVTARCGTRLVELEEALSIANQFLPFEPPHFGDDATLGGCIAAGLSGPRRASAGALRDYLLGARVIDGQGRVLAFGGQVMKNVAGYDVSRLFAGSLGTLGLIAEASLKVLPRPRAERTLELEVSQERALELMNRWAGQPLGVSATCWCDGELRVRLSGAESALRAGAEKIGGASVPDAAAMTYWQQLREHSDGFFAGDEPLWRLAVASDAAPLGLPGRQLIEWGGGLRWLKTHADASTVREAAGRARGHATLFRGGERAEGVFTPLNAVTMRLHRELKAAFDPAGIFNPGRLYPDL
jgi:glycolate oxidase FAD binding subunit